MSVYERRYNVQTGWVSNYVDTPEEVQALADAYGRDNANLWVAEGYADYEDVPGGPGQIEGTIVTRRTLGPVSLSTIDFLVERNRVVALIEALRIPA